MLNKTRFVLSDSSGETHISRRGSDQRVVDTLIDEKLIPSTSINGKTGQKPQRSRPLSRVFKVVRPIHTENTVREALTIRSESKDLKIVLRKLFLQFLYESSFENIKVEALIELAIKVRDNLILEALRAFNIGIPKSLLIVRINAYIRLKNLKTFSRREYLSSKKFRLIVSIEPEFSARLSTIKYSGWRRHQNDHGTLGTGISLSEVAELFIPEEIFEDEIFLLRECLSVGRLPTRGDGSSLMMALNRAETDKFNSLIIEELENDLKQSSKRTIDGSEGLSISWQNAQDSDK